MSWTNPLAIEQLWSKDISDFEAKKRVGEKVAEKVRDGDVIGVGSGSTAYVALLSIQERIKSEGLTVKAIPTSHEMTLTCAQLGIPVTTLQANRPHWGFDGADEVDDQRRLVKGRGGALFREKLVMASSPLTYILVDPSKFVGKLGEKFPIPVEVHPEAIHLVQERLEAIREVEGSMLRPADGKDGPIVTENGHLILDVSVHTVPAKFEAYLKGMTGVVESGLFEDYRIEILSL
ncbi:ribose 5-phosphate isomerase [Pontibacillus halophilus JSM 076056 = DSM 19796]|uniref:Ribose 5-phosphate isomerase A n=1 Tax=Pontibacillus halophilus JSM 076056 = DSM 19796 TaxID=1385510 RepID=A0A0A5I9G4_9BACI|nr:ribose 5-phosphate isomerase A [Pontibacillus halophilus]KGX92472.1 ribose 5-phosphate isomerase [Pontibacillus halophilus JSM 076056 = DSM 19796]